MYSKNKNIGKDTLPKSRVLGVVNGVSFKLIAFVLGSQSVFEVGTKSGFFLCFSVPPSIDFQIKLLSFRICFSVKNVCLFCPVSSSLIRTGVAFLVLPLV